MSNIDNPDMLAEKLKHDGVFIRCKAVILGIRIRELNKPKIELDYPDPEDAFAELMQAFEDQRLKSFCVEMGYQYPELSEEELNKDALGLYFSIEEGTIN